MFPLAHLFTGIATLFCLFGIRKIYLSYQETKSKNLADFLKAFIALGIYYALASLLALFRDPVKVQIIYVIHYTPAILSATLFLRIAFRIFGRLPWSKYIFLLSYFVIIVTTTLNIIFFSPAKIRTAASLFYHWRDGTPFWLSTFYGIFIGILITGCSLLFFLKMRKSKDPFIRARSLRLGTGIMFFVIATLLNYVASGYLQGMIQWASSILATLSALAALILVLSGIYYKVSQEPFPAEKEQISK